MPFKKGQSGNPGGRQKAPYTMKDLMDSLRKAAKEKKEKPFLDFLALKAYESEKVLIEVAKKVLPDLLKWEGELTEETLIKLDKEDREFYAGQIKNVMDALVSKHRAKIADKG